MFTSQAPLLLSSNILPQDQLRQLTQVFANCNQALSHRGTVDLQGAPFYQRNGALSQPFDGALPPWASGNLSGNGAPYSPGAGGSYYGGNYYGVDGPASSFNLAFSPGNSYTFNFSGTEPGDFTGTGPVETPPGGGGYTSDWNTYFGDTNTFDFSDRSARNTNFYYGGPTFQVAGDSYFDNSITQNSYVTNQYVGNLDAPLINGIEARPDLGDPAGAGPGGAPGAPGNPAAAGPGGAAGPAGANGFGLFGVPGQGVQNFFFFGGGFGGGAVGPGVGGFPRPIQPIFNIRGFTPREVRFLIDNILKRVRDLFDDLEATLEDDCSITLKLPVI